MSNPLAVAAVTEALRHRLAEALQEMSDVTVQTARPDALRDVPADEKGVNIFLYGVQPNGALRNEDLRTRVGSRLVERPRIALDLHFLLSFFGDQHAQEPERLLGTVLLDLHVNPILQPAAIERARQAALLLDGGHFLAHTDLDESMEPVRLTPATLGVDEMSKLWAMFPETPYHLSVAYQAGVVIIEADERPGPVLPVASRAITTLPIQNPRIHSVQALTHRTAPIVTGETLLLIGRNLHASGAELRFDGEAVVPSHHSADRIEIPLTPPAAPGAPGVPPHLLRVGVRSLRVDHPAEFGAPPVTRRGPTSNLAAFILRPRVPYDEATNTYAVLTAPALPVPGDPSLRRTTITVTIDPEVHPEQDVTLILNETGVDTPDIRLFDSPPRASAVNQIAFQVNGVRPGTYLLRVQVDGADTPIQFQPGPRRGPEVTVAP